MIDQGMLYSSFGTSWGKKCRYFKRTDRDYVDYAMISAVSAKEHKPDIHITLATDDTTIDPNDVPMFDNILTITDLNEYPFSGKVQAMIQTPYTKTIAMDVDTKILHSRFFNTLDVLDHYELAAVREPDRLVTNGVENGDDGNQLKQYSYIPTCFTELNTGLLCYVNTQAIINMLKYWLQQYEEDMGCKTGRKIAPNDQQALRAAIWRHQPSLYVLPEEYNWRKRDIVRGGNKKYLHTLMHHSRFAQDYDEALEWINKE